MSEEKRPTLRVKDAVSPAECAKRLLNARSGAFGDMIGGVKVSNQTVAELERIARG